MTACLSLEFSWKCQGKGGRGAVIHFSTVPAPVVLVVVLTAQVVTFAVTNVLVRMYDVGQGIHMGRHVKKWAKLNFVARHYDCYYPGYKGHNGVRQNSTHN